MGEVKVIPNGDSVILVLAFDPEVLSKVAKTVIETTPGGRWPTNPPKILIVPDESFVRMDDSQNNYVFAKSEFVLTFVSSAVVQMWPKSNVDMGHLERVHKVLESAGVYRIDVQFSDAELAAKVAAHARDHGMMQIFAAPECKEEFKRVYEKTVRGKDEAPSFKTRLVHKLRLKN